MIWCYLTVKYDPVLALCHVFQPFSPHLIHHKCVIRFIQHVQIKISINNVWQTKTLPLFKAVLCFSRLWNSLPLIYFGLMQQNQEGCSCVALMLDYRWILAVAACRLCLFHTHIWYNIEKQNRIFRFKIIFEFYLLPTFQFKSFTSEYNLNVTHFIWL